MRLSFDGVRSIYSLIAFSILFSHSLVAEDYSAQSKITIPFGKESEAYTVLRALDGDTFKLAGGQNLKLAGINAPELHDVTRLPFEAKRFGKEIWAYRSIGGDALKAVERILQIAGKQIKLEPGTQAFDEEGNLLAYVFIPVNKWEENVVSDGAVYLEDGSRKAIFLNAYLVKMGFAEVLEKSIESKYKDLFLKLEQEAKEKKKGIWG